MIETTEILNEIETEKIAAFNQDKIMFEAVKKYLLSYLYVHGVNIPGHPAKGNMNYALQMAWVDQGYFSDEALGQNLRALAKGVQIIESGFKELSEMKKEAPAEEEISNPAE